MVWFKSTTIISLVAFVVTTSSVDISDYRLPTLHIPKSYSLRLIIDPDAEGFSGEVLINFSTRIETRFLLLHTSPEIITIKEIKLNTLHSCSLNAVNYTTEIALIICSEGIEENDNNQVLLKFTGVYRNKVRGLYKGKYHSNKIAEYFVATQFESTDARMVFPCFDEPQFKAEFDVMIIHPQTYIATSNSPISYRGKLEPYEFTKFRKTPFMSTYLLAFVVSRFSRTYEHQSELGFFPISVYYRPDMKNNTGTALQYGGALVKAHSKFTGIDYEDLGISKMDFVGLPLFSGAMENWGLVLFEEEMLLDEGNKTTPEQKQYIIMVMAHELGHQWFGDYVTLAWWSHVWLNEGFAQFLETHFEEHIAHLDMNLERQFVPKTLHDALESDEISSNPLSNKDDDVVTYSEIVGKFDDISYNKGASIIRMMRSILGKERFQQGIRQYLRENAHKVTDPTKLLKTLGRFYDDIPRSFEELLHNWIYVQGYPLVTVSLTAEGKTVSIRQDDFYNDTSGNRGPIKWHIPITYTTSTYKDFNVTVNNWHFDKPLYLDLESNAWIIVNIQQAGFFRVNYDTTLWHRIINVLTSNDTKQIHVSNRAQLLDDSFVLARRKKIGYKTTFALAEYVRNETEYEPWFVTYKQVRKLITQLKHRNETLAVISLKTLCLTWINEAFPTNKPFNLTTHLEKLTHNLIEHFKLYVGDPHSLEEAQIIYKEYIADKYMEDHNQREQSLCHGVRLSSTPREDYDILLKYYMESEYPFERKDILSALGCISNAEILEQYLLEVLSENSKIRECDVEKVFEAVGSNDELGLDQLLLFLQNNLVHLREKYGRRLKISKFLKQVTRKINNEDQMFKMQHIFEKYQEEEAVSMIGRKYLVQHSDRIMIEDESTKDLVKVLLQL